MQNSSKPEDSDKHKILDVRSPREEQEKSEKLRKELYKKQYQVTIEIAGKVRFMYGNDPVVMETVARGYGAKILKVEKL